MALAKLPTKMYPGFGISMLDRAVKEYFATRCTAADLVQLAEHFAEKGVLRCVYCGAEDPARWDHLHPVSRGGDSTPGNLVPACGRCDDSKQHRTIEEWAASKSRHRPSLGTLRAIQARVARYQSLFVYSPTEFDKKLNRKQRGIYLRFRAKLDALRDQLREDGLIN